MQVKRVRCEASGVLVAKDKAIKRFIVRNIVDASAIRDIQDCSVVDGALLGAWLAAVLHDVRVWVAGLICNNMLSDCARTALVLCFSYLWEQVCVTAQRCA